MSKKICVLFLAILMTVSLFACTPAPETTSAPTTTAPGSTTTVPSDKIEGTFTVWSPAEGFDSFDGKSWTDFMDIYPDIKVELITLGTEDAFAKIKTTIASGAAAELPTLNIIYDPNNIEAMTFDGIWEDLSKDPYNFDLNTQLDFMQGLFKNDKGEILSMSTGNCIMGMTFNRNIAKQYFGTDDPEQVRNMFKSIDDYMAKGKELADKSGATVFLFNSVDHVVRLSLASNNDSFVKDGKLNIDKSYGDAFKLVQQAVADKSVSLQQVWSAPWAAEVQSDTNMFYVCPTWWLGDIKRNDPDAEGKNKYGLISMPDNCVSTWGGTFYFINAASEPSAKRAAYEWMNWACATVEGSKNWVENNGQLTLCKALYEVDSVFATPDKWFADQPVGQVFREISQTDVPLRQGTIYDSAISNAANQALLNLMQGGTAEAALAEMKAAVLALYPELG